MGLTLGNAIRLRPRAGPPNEASERPSVTLAFVGAGGKSTSIFRLARELDRPTLVTTTTHLGVWQAGWADQHVIARSPGDLGHLGDAAVTLVTGPVDAEKRLSRLEPDVLRSLHELALATDRDLLVEADGARQKPLKAPGLDEPQIPEFADLVIVVAGLHGLRSALRDGLVHRPEIFASISGLKDHELVTPDSVVRVVSDRRGGLQGIPPAARRVVLLNQADTDGLQAQARGMAQQLLVAFDAVIVANMADSHVFAAYESCAGIVLAAGGATRFGKPKQLMLWREQPLVRIATRSALDAGLSPVIVVTGAFSDQVREAVKDLPVQIIENARWQEGQGASVRSGITALPAKSGAAVFLLADQPLVGPDVIRALVEAQAAEGACVVAPLLEQTQRGNPVLFDRVTFSKLRGLTGDVGGRSVFRDFPIQYVPWHDASIARDIDTPDDYERLVETDQ